MVNAEATNILKGDDRLELVLLWFKSHAGDVHRMRERAEVIAYGGLPEGATPTDVVAQLEGIWRDAAYVWRLGERQFEMRKKKWPESEASRDAAILRIEGERALDEMKDNVREIKGLVEEIRATVQAAAVQ